jgi:hypothetical protein
MTDFFADTCIFFAYAYPYEDWNDKSVDFFNGNFNRFTGLRVKSEIDRRLVKRRQLYKELAAFLDEGGAPDKFVTSVPMNKNDRQHFEGLLFILLTKSRTDILTYIRDMDEMTRKGIAEAFRKLQSPLIGMSYDPTCENIIQVLVDNRSDAQIFIDALCWSEKRVQSIFVTLDWTDFIRNRLQIYRAIRNYKMINSSDDLPIGIKHIAEIV